MRRRDKSPGELFNRCSENLSDKVSGPFFGASSLLSKIIEREQRPAYWRLVRGFGSNRSLAKRLIRRCPMCKEAMGVIIADPVKNVRPIHGLCMRCGYGF